MGSNGGMASGGGNGGTPVIIGQVSASCPTNVEERSQGEAMSECV